MPCPALTPPLLPSGDTGRSPRMQFHAASLAALPAVERVSLIGYEQSPLPLPLTLTSLPAALKALWLAASLLFTLLSLPRYHLILIQNPPCVPVVLVAYLLSLCNGSRLCIDWHNLGFSIPALLCSLHSVRMVEAQLHWMADAHLCVSREMGEWLRRHFRLRAVTVLYDRPPAAVFNRLFLPPSAGQDEEQAQTLLLMSRQRLMQGSRLPSRTVLTQEAHSGGRVSRRADRASFLVSSTSWTPDEDFSILERCIRNIDAVLVSQELLQDSDGSSDLPLPPRLVVVVTGKGPRRDAFLASLGIDTRTEKNASAEDTLTIGEPLKRVAVKALWLQPEDYPLLLSCADVGVCLHTSTSGLDLPMKVLDMFGAGVPVCAVQYGPVLHELVQDNVNGCLFKDSDELTQIAMELLFQNLTSVQTRRKLICPTGGATGDPLTVLQSGVRSKFSSWEDNWTACMRPVVL
ncbi:unnamed protein product, partial [Ectocarpus fasciculatus]